MTSYQTTTVGVDHLAWLERRSHHLSHLLGSLDALDTAVKTLGADSVSRMLDNLLAFKREIDQQEKGNG